MYQKDGIGGLDLLEIQNIIIIPYLLMELKKNLVVNQMIILLM